MQSGQPSIVLHVAPRAERLDGWETGHTSAWVSKWCWISVTEVSVYLLYRKALHLTSEFLT